jgi:hypothetical protein
VASTERRCLNKKRPEGLSPSGLEAASRIV